MSKYKKGKVYKIIYIGNENINITYIGSTFNTLRDRFSRHKSQTRTSIYTYYEKYGIDNFKMILIKEYEVFDRKHLEMYEQLWINKLDCININNPFEILRKSKEKIQKDEWYKHNKDRLLKKSNLNYQNNKDEILKRLQTKITCECGSITNKGHLSRHIKTKKHIQYISLNSL